MKKIIILIAENILYYENYDLRTVVTPVNVNRLHQLLAESAYDQDEINFLVSGFKNSFDISYRGLIQGVQHLAPNLKITVGSYEILWNKGMKEVKLGHYAGPYKSPPYKNFIQSPIGLVPKDGTDTRLIFHLSYPRTGMSINSETPQEFCSVKYPDFSEAIIRCMEESYLLPCHIAKNDMKSAFRQLGLRPEQFCLLLMKAKSPLDGKTYFIIEKTLPFRASILCSHFQRFSNAVAHITHFHTKKCPINYMDDFLFCAMLKAACDWQVQTFLKICEEICFPVSMEKTYWGTTMLSFLGLLINTVGKYVGIPIDKVEHAKMLITEVLQSKSKKVTVHQLQKLTGFLNFLCRCIVPGRTFTRRIYSFFSSAMLPHHHVRVTSELRSDLQTWESFLNEPTVYCRPFMDFSKCLQAEVLDWYTDTSGKIGYGSICGSKYFYGTWSDELLQKKPSIEYLELFAVTASILLWAKDFQNHRICLFVDNQPVMYYINDSSASCKNCMMLVRMIVLESLRWNMRIFAKHVSSKKNSFADALSRQQFKRFFELAEEEDRTFDQLEKLPMQLYNIKQKWID